MYVYEKEIGSTNWWIKYEVKIDNILLKYTIFNIWRIYINAEKSNKQWSLKNGLVRRLYMYVIQLLICILLFRTKMNYNKNTVLFTTKIT